jgi:hypothetical protein
VVNDTMQTVTDARIYSVVRAYLAAHLVAPLFRQAKVAITTWRNSALAAT